MKNKNNKKFDLIIIGGGPAGLMAGVYALRSGLRALLIEKESYGGQVTTSFEIKNYLGFKEILGPDLAEKMREQVIELGINNLYDNVVSIAIDKNNKTVKTEYSGEYNAPAIIFAPGAYPRKLSIEREDELNGRGIGYCAICDGGFYKSKTVAVVGGGNTAFEDAIYLSNIVKKVYLISRRENYRAIDALVNTAKKIASKTGKIEFIANTSVSALMGDKKLEKIEITNNIDNSKKNLDIDGLFVAIGRIPATNLLKDMVKMDDQGYIIVDNRLETSIKGLYVAGDARVKEIRQIITAASDGAIAATHANTFINENK